MSQDPIIECVPGLGPINESESRMGQMVTDRELKSRVVWIDGLVNPTTTLVIMKILLTRFGRL
jgi:hypothetical protein